MPTVQARTDLAEKTNVSEGTTAHVSETPEAEFRAELLATGEKKIRYLLRQGGLSATRFGILIQTADGETIYEQNPNGLIKPASNLKLVTTAAALEKLGPDFKFRTDIFIDGYLSYGVLHGNLIISGSTDPLLSGFFDGQINEIVKQWVDTLYTLGVQQVRGEVILDNSYYVGNDVEIDDGEEYAPVQFSTVASFTRANTSQLNRVSRVRVINTRSGTKKVVRRGFSRGSRLKRVRIEPNIYLTDALVGEMKARNIIFSEGIEKINYSQKIDRTQWKHIYSHYSAPLSEILSRTNKTSDNFYADQLLRTLGGEYRGEASIEKGIEVVNDFLLYNVGASRDEFHIVDGSGLSHDNQVTPNLLVEVMKYMKRRSKYFSDYYESLSIPTVDGTLVSRIHHELATNIRAKTGSISGITSLSGYLKSRSGMDIYFSIIGNSYRKRTLKRVEDKICKILLDL
ncbi:D-alanyl-D-alanine carboxypeptidase/D-alanyl-D-alanine-endopeptidase [Chloroherpeton thalassium ATCC 35110]|uniref:D-alanyl-D-alanine carboxypeptidase/D-alanyl-D-alanine-endopeptidase n=1 Tax=Chloroherpeton thalassium (strain ATCC 35110 / GB-78) TaxID=517418 RepID=B3QXB7_CHLT3|nr:D-alanyl-D-alanine carboxypeptidase/D-alanyl-D-alanine-endopeptidase [Chloroherpeton thalassium]ACF13391.1 D-alanyl-D-alanine carboxypeptidase/D-alanyl-D-alanine-endopeptidase [Chloroherpeton thalassium ATCC 35110]